MLLGRERRLLWRRARALRAGCRVHRRRFNRRSRSDVHVLEPEGGVRRQRPRRARRRVRGGGDGTNRRTDVVLGVLGDGGVEAHLRVFRCRGDGAEKSRRLAVGRRPLLQG